LSKQLSDAEIAHATALVVDYLRARYEWEQAANRTYVEAGRAGPAERARSLIREEYWRLLRTYCVDRIVNLKLSFAISDPPSVDPRKTRIESVRASGARLIVTTTEDVDPYAGPDTYEYLLERVGERVLLADRRTRSLAGRWIHDVV
jgi:hypothetical protein